MAGPFSYTAFRSASISACFGCPAILAYTSPKPFLVSIPNSANSVLYFSKTGAKKTSTIAPKIIGSETFIIVAFKCTENNTPFAFASSISLDTKLFSAFMLKTALSIISPALSGEVSFNVFVVPSLPTNSILKVSASFTVTDFSLP
ncbi:hypothetical protein D3C86_972990 [compost metagenome]